MQCLVLDDIVYPWPDSYSHVTTLAATFLRQRADRHDRCRSATPWSTGSTIFLEINRQQVHKLQRSPLRASLDLASPSLSLYSSSCASCWSLRFHLPTQRASSSLPQGVLAANAAPLATARPATRRQVFVRSVPISTAQLRAVETAVQANRPPVVRGPAMRGPSYP